ncbi:MAG: quinol monooxygenase YgiN [Paracoccaceae bacterium]|jgi:quinol monooxygenase YgiN
MSIVINLHLKAADGQYDALHAALTAILPDTAARAGAELVSCMANPDDQSFVVHEVWDKKDSQEAYIAWRVERGDIDTLVAMLREPPVFVEMEHLRF